mmetsp:Transcript_132427/g.382823  ORF Transcript_132427/g.382823 Transcript_132427/m.382823 type:complete len:412 (-) Transcript_132427:163-1398(-)
MTVITAYQVDDSAMMPSKGVAPFAWDDFRSYPTEGAVKGSPKRIGAQRGEEMKRSAFVKYRSEGAAECQIASGVGDEMMELEPTAFKKYSSEGVSKGKLSLLERRRRMFTSESGSPMVPLRLRRPSTSDATTITGDAKPIAKLADKYTIHDLLGQGAHSAVYSATKRETGAKVALKSLRIKDEELVASARKEYDILRSLEHRYIIRAGEFFQHSLGVAITMEHFGGRTLQAAVTASAAGRFGEAEARSVFGQLIEAIEYLHRNGIVHRDVKTANVLVSDDMSDVRLIDFSVAHWHSTDGEMLDMMGTPEFLAPEVLLGEAIAEPCDIWGAGLCLHWMLFGKMPLDYSKFCSQRDFAHALRRKFEDPDTFEGMCVGHPKKVLYQCLTHAEDRATASDLLACEWVTKTQSASN